MREDEPTSTVIAVDGCFKLCSHLKIVFDMSAYSPDNKIKIHIIL
jgi:hypothetical protein